MNKSWPTAQQINDEVKMKSTEEELIEQLHEWQDNADQLTRNLPAPSGYCCSIFPNVLNHFPRIVKYSDHEGMYIIADPDYTVAYFPMHFCIFCGRKLERKKKVIR
jgi:hypothetical protein